MNYWKCPLCDDVSHYKGLCRICTEYDSGGGVKGAVHRIRVDEGGNEWKKSVYTQRQPYDVMAMKQRFLDQRRKKMTKRQKATVKKQKKALIDAQKEIKNGEFIEIGEAVGDEEE